METNQVEPCYSYRDSLIKRERDFENISSIFIKIWRFAENLMGETSLFTTFCNQAERGSSETLL